MKRKCDETDNFNYEYDNAIGGTSDDDCDDDDDYKIASSNSGITNIDRNYLLGCKERLWPTWGENVSRILSNEDAADREQLLEAIKAIEDEHSKQNRANIRSDTRRGNAANRQQLQQQQQQQQLHQPMDIDEDIDLPGSYSLENRVIRQVSIINYFLN